MTNRAAEPRADAPQPPAADSAPKAKADSTPAPLAACVVPTTKFWQSKLEPTLALMVETDWKETPEYMKADAYVEKIKKRFDDGVTYERFLDLLQMYQREEEMENEIVVGRVYEKVKVLLKDHPDLVEGFSYWLPQRHPSATGPQAAGGVAGGAQDAAGKSTRAA